MTEPLFDPSDFLPSHTNKSFEDFFEEGHTVTAPYYKIVRTKNVNWYIRKGTVKVDSDYIIPTHGNIWNFSKMLAIKNYLEDGGKLNLPSVLGTINRVSITEIAEDYDTRDEDLLAFGKSRRFTTSIEELDEYLNASYVNDKNRMEEIEEDYPEFKGYLKLMKKGKKPKGIDLGDFGKTYANIGNNVNHRVFGAILAGEPYIYIGLELGMRGR
jgi:hypothetical protein